jgi:hypothetical protein
MNLNLIIEEKYLLKYLTEIFNKLNINIDNNKNTKLIQQNNKLVLIINNKIIKEYILNKILCFFDIIDILKKIDIKFKLFDLLHDKYIYSCISSSNNLNLIDNNDNILDENIFNKAVKNYNDLSNIKKNYNNVEELENLYCFIFYGSFIFHYWMMSILPLFIELINNKNNLINICIDENYKKLFFELCKIFNISIKNINIIYFINQKIDYKKYCYKVKNIYIPTFMCTSTTNMNYIILRYLKYYFSIKNNLKEKNDKIYIERDYTNKYILGNYRTIINKEDIKDLLSKNNYNIYKFENLSFEEKFNKICNASIIVVEAGSTLVNLYFCLNKNTKIIILNSYGNYHNHPHTTVHQPKDFFENIIQIIGDTENKLDIQSRFKINIDELSKYI